MTERSNETIDKFTELADQLMKVGTLGNELIELANLLELSDRDRMDLAAIVKRMDKRVRNQMIKLVKE